MEKLERRKVPGKSQTSKGHTIIGLGSPSPMNLLGTAHCAGWNQKPVALLVCGYRGHCPDKGFYCDLVILAVLWLGPKPEAQGNLSFKIRLRQPCPLLFAGCTRCSGAHIVKQYQGALSCSLKSFCDSGPRMGVSAWWSLKCFLGYSSTMLDSRSWLLYLDGWLISPLSWWIAPSFPLRCQIQTDVLIKFGHMLCVLSWSFLISLSLDRLRIPNFKLCLNFKLTFLSLSHFTLLSFCLKLWRGTS